MNIKQSVGRRRAQKNIATLQLQTHHIDNNETMRYTTYKRHS